MPKNRMTFHDMCDELPPVTIEILKGDVLRFTQKDGAGRINIVILSSRHVLSRGDPGSRRVMRAAVADEFSGRSSGLHDLDPAPARG